MDTADDYLDDYSDLDDSNEELLKKSVKVEETPLDPVPEYTEEEMNLLISFVQKLTHLFALNDEDWCDETLDVIRTWFLQVNEFILNIYYDGPILHATLTFPLAPVYDITYFIRKPQQIFTVEGFHDEITFGTIKEDIEGSLLTILQDIYAPVFLSSEKLTVTVKTKLCTALHKFLAFLTELHFRFSGITVLYMPVEGLNPNIVETAADREIVKQLEVVVVHWTTIIRKTLADKKPLVPRNLVSPPDEYDFWTYRYEVLLALSLQMQHPDYEFIMAILKQSQSIYVKQMVDIQREVLDELEVANNNIDFLQVIVGPCQDLNQCETPLDVPPKLKRIMHIFRVIWINSKYFNTKESMTNLYQYLSNQIIIFCRNKIDVKKVLEGYPRMGIKIATMSLDCCIAYRIIYDYVANYHREKGDPVGWDLDEAAIFNPVDAFVQRLYDLMEICNAMIVFGRCDETADIPAPLFGGNQGKEFEKTCAEIEQKFKKGLINIQNVSSHVLDVHNTDWYDDVAKYRTLIKDLEEIVENLISNVFLNNSNIEESVEALCSLYYFSARNNLRPAYIRQANQMWHNLSEKISNINRLLVEQVDEMPSWLPRYAGRAFLLKITYNRINRLFNIISYAEWLPECASKAKAVDAFEKMQASLTKNIKLLNDQWLDSMTPEIINKLNRTLMSRSLTHPGFLECNIDREILDICDEARHFEMMGFGTPVHVNQIYGKANTIRTVYESVVTVVRDYNKILSALSDKERLLFKGLILNCERRIMPGVYKLTWGADFIDSYITQCAKQTGLLQDFVDLYKKVNLEIVKICEKICGTFIIKIESVGAMEMDEIKEIISRTRKQAAIDLLEMYHKILELIQLVYEGFEAQIDTMAEEWAEYVRRIDNLIQEAFRSCVRGTLQYFYTLLHGDGAMGPLPLLKFTIDLFENKLTFSPKFVDIFTYFNNIPIKILKVLTNFPRLYKQFKLPPLNSEKRDYFSVIQNDEDINHLEHLIKTELEHNDDELTEYTQNWGPFRSIWEIPKFEFVHQYETSDTKAKVFDMNIANYVDLANQTSVQETITEVYFSEINSHNLKESIYTHIDEWKELLKETLKKKAYNLIYGFYDYTKTNTEKILRVPKNITEMQTALTLYEKLRAEVRIQEEKFPEIKEHFQVIDKYEMVIAGNIRTLILNLDNEWITYVNILKDSAEMLDNCKDTFKLNLLSDAELLKENAKLLVGELKNLPTSSKLSPKEALDDLQEMRNKLEALVQTQTDLMNDLGTFGINIPENLDLVLIDKELKILEEIWGIAGQWEDAWFTYKTGNFWEIKTDEMEEFAVGLFRKLNRLCKQYRDKDFDILESTRKQVDEFRRTLPLLVSLKNQSMRPRHWNRVKNLVVCDFDENSEEFNLEAIVKMNFQHYADEIIDISYAATMELQIESGIKNIREIWAVMGIEIVFLKDGIYRLKNVDDCFAALEEHSVQISAMKATRFVEPFAEEVNYWEKSLNYIMETVENCLIVQRQWLYLDNIFQGDDIRKQLPEETAKFTELTNDWKFISSQMFKAPNALQATQFKPVPWLLDKLLKMTDDLELIQRALEAYLETKRQAFPRFYFISNDDLLEILGNAKKPDAVQLHMKKLFDNLNKCKLNKNTLTKNIKWECIGMYADDGEYVQFLDTLILAGPSEKWLTVIEKAMRDILRDQLKLTRKSLQKMTTKRDKWLNQWPGQLCLTSSQMQWTSDCTKCLVLCKMFEVKKPLKKLRKKQNNILAKLSEMSRKELPKQLRLKVNSLITIEIHGRDVIDRMYKMNCRDISHFEWFSQLRFYWDRDHDDCVIKQTNTKNWYGYEYTGNSGRLVITPLTDRCYITLTTALHLYRGGSPKGPAGTGKTETVKDLGKALGMWVIVTNCSEGLDYKSMGKCFSGLAQTGAWGCFDEFNRINIEVLSVVAQQILSILSALTQKLTKFILEGQLISLVPTVGLFITMNPGYAGRTELPDNLKSMFRPISMIVPDNIIIAENLLFSDGFQNTKSLAKKVFTLYDLAKQQLSKQNHYDFGLRSMVALLRYGGRKRRQFPNEDEERMVYLAMADMNLAKLTSDDYPLFLGIMSDIFPGITLPVIDYQEFLVCIKNSFKEMNLQTIEAAIFKVIQLYETKNSRHSVMILGQTGTAKSVTWKVLKSTFEKMRILGKPDWVDVTEYPVNPKSLSLGELYGEYNLSTGEWLDGVLSAIMRKICQEEGLDQKWMLFDGPVDAVWIENMNSVMDDNKVLTLVNSERITMPAQVSLLFEVADLSVASPATVSRCGMVYNDYKDWGWRPYIQSWLSYQKDQFYLDTLNSLLNQFFDRVLLFKRLNCVETAPTNELNLIQSFCHLMDCLATKENGIIFGNEENLETMAKMWFLFCMIWSLCATVNEAGRLKIDAFIREMEGIFPLKDTIYDYYVDIKHRAFMSWEDKLSDAWRYNKSLPFYKIIVPTVDTVRYNYLVSNLLNQGNPVLLVGAVGTGKTSTATSVLGELDPDQYSILSINMSAQTTSKNIQDTIEGRTEKRTKGVFVPIGGKKMVCFMDDFNMPAKDTYGSQHALELIRQWIDYGFWYDRQKQWRTYIKQMFLMTAMGPAGGGRQEISPRTQSRFNMINLTFPSEATIVRIFGTLLGQQLSDFPEEIKQLGKLMTSATINLYKQVILKMLPTPAKTHYLFNLRDISKIFQGLLRCNKDYHISKPTMLRLWIHECFRVFCDRLNDDKDISWFVNEINTQLGKYFELTFHNLCPNKLPPLFGDFISAMYYEDFTNPDILRKFMLTQLEEYNNSPGVVKADLVLFRDAIEHMVRIIRVVSQPRGNMLLIGIGGSGRQSLSKVSSYIAELNTFTIEVTRKYKTQEFREDLKTLYQLIGVENKGTSFLFNDTQVAEENFMEILNNMLSVGEVANLYKPDEFEEIKNALEPAAAKAKIVCTTESIFAFFMERARSNLHITICMSPIGNEFRVRIRQYPALVNNTTIDWFREWPEQALLEVADKYLSACKLDVGIVEKDPEERANRESLIIPTEDKLRIGVAATFAFIHTSVAQMSQVMLNELKRYNYVTPLNYLELVSGFQNMLARKRHEISTNANRLRNGVLKIEDTREKVEGMSEELKISSEQVIEFQAECDKFILNIQSETADADEQKEIVELQGKKIGEEEAEVLIMAAAAEKDLLKAMPALDAATLALNALNKKDLTEVKSYAKPPLKVERVMEAVMILLGKDPSWAEAKRQLGEQSFLDQLKNYDRNHISEKTLKKISRYTLDPELEPTKVGTVSLACMSLMKWVIAIERYGKIYKIVGPKIELVDDLKQSLAEKQQQLFEAKQKLDQLAARLNKLREDYEEKANQKEQLRIKAEQLKLKIERAFMLVDGLSGECVRWIDTVKKLDLEFSFLPGDCILATAFISYLGPFVTVYRDSLVKMWRKEITTRGIPSCEDFLIWDFLSDPATVREWNIQGLPTDEFSTENGIIVTKGTRWPLVIDPQCQAQNWIKKMEKRNDLQLIDFGQTDFVRTLEMALQLGKPVLLQNVSEVLDPVLLPILNKAIVKSGGQILIKFNDKMLGYNENFRFFITTKLSNPHYPPEIATKTTLVNFAIKEKGLQEQLLGIVVRKEKPILEEQKDTLVVNIAKNRKILIDLEKEILRLLNESRGSLLDDEELFATLQTSKSTSAIVKESLSIAEVTEIEIDAAREGYRPCASRAAILFFVLLDMSRIDPMYQFSLDAYVGLFTQSIERSVKNPTVEVRIQNLNDFHTYAVYKNTCRGLFEVHKLLFSFYMCAKILAAANKLNETEFNFLLKGGVVLDRQEQEENPCPGWISDIAWDNVTELDKLPGFHGVTQSFEKMSKDWFSWFSTTQPEIIPLVGDWDGICNYFQKMLFIRCLRPDRITTCVRTFIVNTLGPRFVEPPVLDIKSVFEESSPRTPLIFVLSPGVDPTSALQVLAETTNMFSKYFTLSLGQGQAPIATKMIEEGVKQGHWVFLANCHLSLSWMPDLDKIVDTIQSSKPHRKFRLWLSSNPTPDFPISILQAGIKMTTEPPKGIKANLKRLYNLITEDQFNLCKAKTKYKRLLFTLCFFHAVLLERKKFQQLGWNIVYSFNDSDFEVSENLLTIYLDEYPETPWDALKYLIAGVNYGGHVTDEWDRRLLLTYMHQYYNDDVLIKVQYMLSSLSAYYVPRDGFLESYKDYINLLPNVDSPEVFGQHTNADIATLITESRILFETLLSLESQGSSGGAESGEEKVNQLAADILSKIPKVMDMENTSKLIGPHKSPLDVILLQEMERYNFLLKLMKKGLLDLQKGIKGLVVMSADLDAIYSSMLDGRVPGIWLASYNSLKPLGSWSRDLVLRVEHFSTWADTTHPPVLFWLAAFTFPTGFLTAVLQTSARENEIPIDALSWEFNVSTLDEALIIDPPQAGGVYIKGSYLEGAGWNMVGQCLKEPLPMELVSSMPIIHFKPIESVRRKTKGIYMCPCYYFPIRAGSFVIAVELKSGTENSDFWVKRGTALLLSLGT